MKTCPECAESVQEAARKCRFCGYRFDAPPEKPKATKVCPECAEEIPEDAVACELCGSALAGAAATPQAPPAASRWPYATGAAGAFLLALGTLVFGVSWLVYGPGGRTPDPVAIAAIGGLGLGGLVLAVGWGGTMARGHGGLGVLLGSLAVPVSLAIGTSILAGGGDPDKLLAAIVVNGGFVACALAHYVWLEGETDFPGARPAAGCLVFGTIAPILAGRYIDLPTWVLTTCSAIAWVALLWFGIALGIGLLVRRA